MGQKQGFLNLLKNLVINFYCICFMMKIYIICYVPAQISYLGYFTAFEWVWSKMGVAIYLVHKTLKSAVS